MNLPFLVAVALAIHLGAAGLDDSVVASLSMVQGGAVVYRWQADGAGDDPGLYRFVDHTGAVLRVQRLIEPDRLYAVTFSPDGANAPVALATVTAIPPEVDLRALRTEGGGDVPYGLFLTTEGGGNLEAAEDPQSDIPRGTRSFAGAGTTAGEEMLRYRRDDREVSVTDSARGQAVLLRF